MEDSPEALRELKSNVSRETINKLDVYRSLILAEKQSLISKKDKNLLWIRHFYDSLRISAVSYTHLTLPTNREV